MAYETSRQICSFEVRKHLLEGELLPVDLVVFDQHEPRAVPSSDILEVNTATGIRAVAPDCAVPMLGFIPPEHPESGKLFGGLVSTSNRRLDQQDCG